MKGSMRQSPPRVPLPEIAPPTPVQLAKLQKAIDANDPEFGVFVRRSAMTGARRSEMLALRSGRRATTPDRRKCDSTTNHYVATRLLSAGVDVRTVAGRLGHRNAATTLNVYSHFVPEADQDAAEIPGRLSAPDESGE